MYMSKIEQILSNAEVNMFSFMRTKLVWFKNTRRNIVLEISQIAQLTQAIYENDISIHHKRLDKAIKYVHDHKVSIRILNVDYSLLKSTAYSDADISNHSTLSSQLEQIFLLTDDNRTAIPVYTQSYKSLSAARSVLPAEVIAFAGSFHDVLAICK